MAADLLYATTGIDNEIGRVTDKQLNNMKNVDLNDNPAEILTNLRRKNLYRPVIGHININFLYSKYEALKSLIKDKLDFLVVTETKVDESYTSAQFHIEGFTNPFRLDRDRFGGGVTIFVNSHLPVREIPFETKPKDIEVIFLELTLRFKKVVSGRWLLPKKRTCTLFSWSRK